ncbi:MAG: erythromycin esterase family protein, partial [Thermoanaerobaculia bacterium]
ALFTMPHDYYAGFAPRDAAMAQVFQTLRNTRYPGAKTVIWAANVHIARNRLPRGEVPMGSWLAAALRDDYVSFAITAYQTEVDWAPVNECGLRERARGSVEERLQKLGQEALIVDTSRSRYLKRQSYPMGIDSVRPYQDYDGILWLKHSEKMHPLLWPPCQ